MADWGRPNCTIIIDRSKPRRILCPQSVPHEYASSATHYESTTSNRGDSWIMRATQITLWQCPDHRSAPAGPDTSDPPTKCRRLADVHTVLES